MITVPRPLDARAEAILRYLHAHESDPRAPTYREVGAATGENMGTLWLRIEVLRKDGYLSPSPYDKAARVLALTDYGRGAIGVVPEWERIPCPSPEMAPLGATHAVRGHGLMLFAVDDFELL